MHSTVLPAKFCLQQGSACGAACTCLHHFHTTLHTTPHSTKPTSYIISHTTLHILPLDTLKPHRHRTRSNAHSASLTASHTTPLSLF